MGRGVDWDEAAGGGHPRHLIGPGHSAAARKMAKGANPIDKLPK